MQSTDRDYSQLAIMLYAYQAKRLAYWRTQETSFTDALARYAAVKMSAANKSLMTDALLIAIGESAQSKRDAVIDGIEDSETLTAEQQEDIYNQVQDYQRIIFGAAEMLDVRTKQLPDGIA